MDPTELLPSVRHLAFFSHVRDLTIAYALAFLIGWNREHEGRSAGLRTFPLVAIAACGFVQASEGLLRDEPEGMARIVEGVVDWDRLYWWRCYPEGRRRSAWDRDRSLALGDRGDRHRGRPGELRCRPVVCLFTVLTLYVLGRLKPKSPETPEG